MFDILSVWSFFQTKYRQLIYLCYTTSWFPFSWTYFFMTNRLQALYFWLLTILYYIWFLKLIWTSFITLSIAHKSWWFANPYLMSPISQMGGQTCCKLICIWKGVSIPIPIQNLHLVTSFRMSSTLPATVQPLLTSHYNNSTQSKLIESRELCKNCSEQQWMSYVSGEGGSAEYIGSSGCLVLRYFK